MRAPALALAAALASAAGLASSCSSEASVTATIGSAGGLIEVGGATVRFPANALAADVAITIAVSEDGPPAGFVALSQLFVCGPTGTDFAVPVVMEMPFESDGGSATMFWSAGADPAFKDVGGTATGAIMRAEVRHFSSGFVGRTSP